MFYLAILSYIAIFILLARLFWIDLKYYLLPNIYNGLLFFAFLVFHTVIGWAYITPLNAVIGGVLGGGFLIILRAIANALMKADTVGFGDIKFMLAAGFGLGVPNVFLVLSIGAFIGLIHGCILYRRQKGQSTNNRLNIAHVNVPAGVGFCLACAGLVIIQFWHWWELF